MKSIEEKAKEYANEVNGELGEEIYHDSEYTRNEITETDFIAGYKAAFEWISVDDEFPKDNTEILVKNTEWTDYMFYTSDDEDTIRAEYTHWRPINND